METETGMTDEKRVNPASSPIVQALWNMRWAALFIGTPLFALVMIELTFGLPQQLLLPAAAFLALNLVLFALLVRGEVKRIRRAKQSH